jgi:serine/threonine-protein kinase
MQDTGDQLIAGRYLLREVLGAGGMGVVFRAVDLKHGRDVALKILHPRHRNNQVVIHRFAAEAHAGRCVRHPNVVAVHGSGTSADGTPFLVMELVSGQLLDKLIGAAGELPLRRAVAIVRQVLAGLGALHDAGFVHGDVKTANVLVDATRADAVVLIDLGLARAPDRFEAAKARLASGTPEYMAPEVIRGDGTRPGSDVYAAGVVLYQLLTGAPPFEGATSREILRRHLDDDAVPPSLRSPERGIPAALERAVMTALAKDPCARHPSAAAFSAALGAALPIVEPEAQPRPSRVACSATVATKEWILPELVPGRPHDTGLLVTLTVSTARPPTADARPRSRSRPAGSLHRR